MTRAVSDGSYLNLGLALLAVGITVVMGVASFTASGPPTTPSVEFVRVLGTGGDSPTLVVVVHTDAWSTQPENSVDTLGDRVIWSAWTNSSVLATDQAVALYQIAGKGPHTVLAATLMVPLPRTWDYTPGSVMLNVTVQVQTYPGDYYASLDHVCHNVTSTGGTQHAVRAYYVNAVWPLVAAAGLDVTLYAPMAESRQRRYSLLAVAGATLVVLALWVKVYAGWP